MGYKRSMQAVHSAESVAANNPEDTVVVFKGEDNKYHIRRFNEERGVDTFVEKRRGNIHSIIRPEA
jgi:hypothetical protein